MIWISLRRQQLHVSHTQSFFLLNGWVPLEDNIFMSTFGSLVPLKRCLHRVWAKYLISSSGAAIADPLSLKMNVRVRIYSTSHSPVTALWTALFIITDGRVQTLHISGKWDVLKAVLWVTASLFLYSSQPLWANETKTHLYSLLLFHLMDQWFSMGGVGLFWCFNANVGFYIIIIFSSWI